MQGGEDPLWRLLDLIRGLSDTVNIMPSSWGELLHSVGKVGFLLLASLPYTFHNGLLHAIPSRMDNCELFLSSKLTICTATMRIALTTL